MIVQLNENMHKMKYFIDNELENIRHTYIKTPARIVTTITTKLIEQRL